MTYDGFDRLIVFYNGEVGGTDVELHDLREDLDRERVNRGKRVDVSFGSMDLCSNML